MQWGQEIPSATGGNQKRKGAAPSLSRRANRMKGEKTSVSKRSHTELPKSKEDPRAWDKKYLRAASA